MASDKIMASDTTTTTTTVASDAPAQNRKNDCIFCRIIEGTIPSFKLIETDTVCSFLDIKPLSRGHALVIPKFHAAKLHDLPDEYLPELLLIAKKIAAAQGLENYNILQNNGWVAHQEIGHVHLHVIPKPSASHDEGLVIGWPMKMADLGDLKTLHEKILAKLAPTNE